MKCSNCGLDSEGNFCSNCGQPLMQEEGGSSYLSSLVHTGIEMAGKSPIMRNQIGNAIDKSLSIKNEVTGIASQTTDNLQKITLIRLFTLSFDKFKRDDGDMMAAGISYFAVLAMFPLVLGIISLAGFVVQAETIQKAIFDFIQANVPGVASIVQDAILGVIKARGEIGLVSIFSLIWSGAAIFGTMSSSINRAWNIKRGRPYIKNILFNLGMTFLIGAVFIGSIIITGVIAVIDNLNLPVIGWLISIAGGAVAFLLIFAVYALMYKLMPLTKTYWRDVLVGAVFSSVLFEIARSAFTLYLSQFAHYNLVYGSVASVVILFVWIYYSALVVVLGAEVASEHYRLRTGRVQSPTSESILPKSGKP
jgi:membrane protein